MEWVLRKSIRPLDITHAKTLPSASPLQLMRKLQISHLSKDGRGKRASMDEKCTWKEAQNVRVY